MDPDNGYKPSFGYRFLYACGFLESSVLSAASGFLAGVSSYGFLYTNDWKTASYLTVLSLGIECAAFLNLRRNHRDNVETPKKIYESFKILDEITDGTKRMSEDIESITKGITGQLDNISKNIDKIGGNLTPL